MPGQPDLGSGLVYLAILGAILFVAGTPWTHFAALGALAAVCIALVVVAAPAVGVEVLEQRYLRLPDDGDHPRFHYSSRAFAFEAELVYDASGLVIDYPGIATRAA